MRNSRYSKMESSTSRCTETCRGGRSFVWTPKKWSSAQDCEIGVWKAYLLKQNLEPDSSESLEMQDTLVRKSSLQLKV